MKKQTLKHQSDLIKFASFSVRTHKHAQMHKGVIGSRLHASQGRERESERKRDRERERERSRERSKGQGQGRGGGSRFKTPRPFCSL